MTLGLLEKIPSLMTDLQCELEHFKGRIIFMSMYNDIERRAKGNKDDVNTIDRHLRIVLADSLAVFGLSWSLDEKRVGTELTLTYLTDRGINQQRI